jgi:Carboxypeptidase regulatory-like domain/TonB dependent receptor
VDLRLDCIIRFLIAVVLCAASALSALGQSPAPPPANARAIQSSTTQAQGAAATGAVTVRGHITDQTGALIPGARVSVTDASGNTVRTTADAGGAYDLRGLAPGSYIVKAEFDGFAPFVSQPITLSSGQVKRVDIAMAIQVEQQNVVVTDDTAATVNVEASGNANAIVLKGKDLDALSDDPDELSSELSALAGPSAGPNGGQIFIDGFSGGSLPPKSAIREIRINQNPFSAEYDRLGYGRIEILTKPGTDKLHGQAFFQSNNSIFNTGNPFTPDIPSYYSYQYNATVSGAINKKASFFVSNEGRDINNVNAWRIPVAVLQDSSGQYYAAPSYGVTLPNQRIRNNSSARVDWQLGTRNTVTARFGFWYESEHGNLSAGSLPDASTHESNTDYTVQASDAFVIDDHAVNETRFQFERQNENHYPDSNDPTITVQGNFVTGGYPGQTSRDHAMRLELQNVTTLSHGSHAIKFGTRLRDYRDSNFTNNNYNGSYSFNDYDKYLNMANGLAAGQSFNDLVTAGYGPSAASYTVGDESALANMFDIGLFAQDDWKVNPRLTVSGGVRWEAQNHIADHNDWAPRVSMAYALDGGHGKPPKTVLRAGYGLFYDRFQVTNLMTVQHSNTQSKTLFNNPTCSSTAASGGQARSLNEIDLSTCSTNGVVLSGSTIPVKYEIDPHFRSPYTGQAGIGLERQLNKGSSLTLTYLHSFGVHQLVSINANQYNPVLADAGDDPFPLDPSGGYIYQFYPQAVYKQDQLITNVNARVSKNLNLVGFYTAARANSNGGGGSNASNAYNLDQDYGPATFVSGNQVFAMANYSAPWKLRFAPFLIAQSGKPFNVTLPEDPLNNFYNQRPGQAGAAQCQADPTRYIYEPGFGCLDSQPQLGETLVPANMGRGPAAVAINLRVSRAFGFGPETGATAGPNGPGGPPDGGGRGPGGGRGGPPGGSLGPGGLGGGGGRGGPGGMFGPAGTGRKYSLNFSVQALNLFNNINYGGPNGVLGSPHFDSSTTLAGGIFSTGSAARRIFGQVVFTF